LGVLNVLCYGKELLLHNSLAQSFGEVLEGREMGAWFQEVTNYTSVLLCVQIDFVPHLVFYSVRIMGSIPGG